MVCVKCSREMKVEKNGVKCVFYSGGQPYKIHSTDRYECPECKTQVLTGFSKEAMHRGCSERFDDILKQKGIIHVRG